MLLRMKKNELKRIILELDTAGYSLTSFDELGLTFDSELASRLCDAAAEGEFSPAAADLTKHIEKKNMTMVQDEKALALGKLLVSPVVDVLFADSARARRDWQLYAMNRYEDVGSLGGHRDSVGSTVLVATISGVRRFDVYRGEDESGDFSEIEQSFTVTPGSIMILDGQIDPGHSVACIESPSVSAVFDVPDLLRP